MTTATFGQSSERITAPERGYAILALASLNAVMAVALAYAMRKNRLALLFIALNIVVILSTPTQGGHYFVDVLGGIFTALMAIFTWTTWAGSISREPWTSARSDV